MRCHLTARTFRIPATLAVAILLMVSTAASVFADGPAGILLYHRDGEDVFLLLANDSKGVRGWGGFGGNAEPGETPRATAAQCIARAAVQMPLPPPIYTAEPMALNAVLLSGGWLVRRQLGRALRSARGVLRCGRFAPHLGPGAQDMLWRADN